MVICGSFWCENYISGCRYVHYKDRSVIMRSSCTGSQVSLYWDGYHVACVGSRSSNDVTVGYNYLTPITLDMPYFPHNWHYVRVIHWPCPIFPHKRPGMSFGGPILVSLDMLLNKQSNCGLFRTTTVYICGKCFDDSEENHPYLHLSEMFWQ